MIRILTHLVRRPLRCEKNYGNLDPCWLNGKCYAASDLFKSLDLYLAGAIKQPWASTWNNTTLDIFPLVDFALH